MILVEIHCPKCQKVLARVTERPADPLTPLRVPPCAKHDRPRAGRFFVWARPAASRGEKPMLTLGWDVSWSVLIPLIERAERVGRTMHESV